MHKALKGEIAKQSFQGGAKGGKTGKTMLRRRKRSPKGLKEVIRAKNQDWKLYERAFSVSKDTLATKVCLIRNEMDTTTRLSCMCVSRISVARDSVWRYARVLAPPNPHLGRVKWTHGTPNQHLACTIGTLHAPNHVKCMICLSLGKKHLAS